MNIVDSSRAGWSTRGKLRLPMADGLILATARAHNLWTQDEHLRDLDGVKKVKKIER